MEIRKIFTAGNSLVIAIPRDMANYLGWHRGDQVLIQLGEKSRIQIEKVSREFLVSGVRKEVVNG
jgi:antitoxin component of MazEF toxin-antitoxin module